MSNIKYIKEKIYRLNYILKLFILLFFDQIILNLTLYYLTSIFFYELNPQYLFIVNVLFFILNITSRHNLSVLRFLEINYYLKTIIFLSKFFIILLLLNLLFIEYFYFKLFIHSFIFLYVGITINRFLIYLIVKEKDIKNQINVVLYGSGKVASYFLSQNNKYKVCAIIDDDVSKNGRFLKGIKIYHPTKIDSLKKKYNFTIALIAINKLTNIRKEKIFTFLSKYNISINIIDSFENNISNNITNFELRKINFDDLVNRQIEWSNEKIKPLIYSKVTLVTGAGGTIGSSLALYLLTFKPKKLILLDHSEYALYELNKKIDQNSIKKNVHISYLTKSVRILNDIKKVFTSEQIDNVFHTAAYKHVPIQETNLSECLQNNVISTYTIAKLSYENNVKNFKLISTDKAVRPTNIMGASKRLAELIIQAYAKKNSNTVFSIVRFGNVIGSSGSAFPLFLKQIYDHKHITITHRKVTRFFMTSKEAIGLILESTHMAKGGDVFLLNMGDPIKILDLGKKMIKLMGYSIKDKKNPNGDIKIKFIGLRPGEKLYEELLITNSPITTSNKDIFKAREKSIPFSEMVNLVRDITKFLKTNEINKIYLLLNKYVEGYKGVNNEK